MTTSTENNPEPRYTRLFLLLAGLAGLAGLAALVMVTLDTGLGILGGFSAARLGLGLGISFCSLALIGMSFFLRSRPYQTVKITAFIHRLFQNSILYIAIVAIALAVVIVGVQFILFSLAVGDNSARAALIRFVPVVIWVTLLAIEIIMFLPLFRFGGFGRPGGLRPVLISGVLTLTMLLCVGAFMKISGLGLRPDLIGWHEPGAPIIPLWLTLAWSVGVFCAALGEAFRWKKWLFDGAVAVLLWAAAVSLWQAQPLRPNYFLLRPGQPNYEYYPYSDAGALDVAAQQILIGEGYGSGALKPLYTTFLAGLHAVAGQRYPDIANAQILVLAIFPVILYLLGLLLHHRIGGAIAAVLIILREAGAIALSGEIRVAHAKLLLSDLPTAVGLAAFVLLVTYWLAKKPDSRGLPILAGGILGFLILLRPQMMALSPLVLFFVIVYFIRNPRLLLRACLLMLLGLVVSLSGWLGRTWVKTGSPMVSDAWQTAYMSGIYTLNPDTQDVFRSALQPLPGESSPEYSRRIQTAVLDFIFTHPDVAAGFVGGHFLHNQAEALLILPATFTSVYSPHSAADWMITGQRKPERVWEECCSPVAYVESLPFWKDWEGYLPAGTILPLFIGLCFVSLGIAASWRKLGWAGLFPLWIEVCYALSSAVGRQSGWRFILPVDWVVILFFAIGLGQATQWAGTVFFNSKATGSRIAAPSPTWRFSWIAALIFLLAAGCSFPLIETLLPGHFTSDFMRKAIGNVNQKKMKEALGLDTLDEQGISQAGLTVTAGRALYPRFYRGGQGEMSTGAPAYFPRTQNRVAFILINRSVVQTILPAEDAPDVFPHAADALVIGCARTDHLEAWAVILPGLTAPLLTRSPADAQPCRAKP